MAKEKQEGWKLAFKKVIAVFTTFFIVIGVALVSLLSSDNSGLRSIPSEDEAATSTEIIRDPSLFFIREEGAFLMNQDGSESEIYWPDDLEKLKQPISQIECVAGNSGKRIWLDPEFKPASARYYRSPDGRRNARMGEVLADGSTEIFIKHGADEDRYILRGSKDMPWSDLGIVGWPDAQNLVFAGNVSGTRSLIAMGLGGVENVIAQLSPEAACITAGGGAIYYISATKTLRNNIEEVASSIIKLDLKGNAKVVIEEKDVLIQNYILNNEEVIYTLADQTMKSTSRPGDILAKGIGYIFNDDFIVFKRNGRLWWKSLIEDREREIDAQAVCKIKSVHLDEDLNTE
ncbi:MAG: hypothetical protein ACOYUZ_00935 [Patescibacteria group bacterium]